MKSPDQDDAKLAAKIGDALKAYDAADTVKNEKAVIAGRLLVEAQKRHPGKKAFEHFLELAGGIGIRRAETFIAIALGRKDFEQHQAENAAAQQRHRDKLKADKIEREKAKAALPEPKPAPDPTALRNAQTPQEMSAASLREFEAACRSHLPLLSIPDLKTARAFVALDGWRSKTRKAA
jgi:hypothetical protein